MSKFQNRNSVTERFNNHRANYLSIALADSVAASGLTSSICARMQQYLESRSHPRLQVSAKCPRGWLARNRGSCEEAGLSEDINRGENGGRGALTLLVK